MIKPFHFFFLAIMLIMTSLVPEYGYGVTSFRVKEEKKIHTILFTFKKVPTSSQVKKIERYVKKNSVEI